MSTLSNKHPYLEEGFVNVNDSAQKLLNNPLIAKDIWQTVDDLGLIVNLHQKALTISFESIRQDWLKLLAKLYVLVRSERKLSAEYIRSDIYNLNRFSQFVESKLIFNYSHINDQLFDEYDYYLHSLALSQSTKSLSYMTLTNFFNRLGMVRQQQGLEVDQQRLVIRIEGLEKIDDRD